MEYSNNNKHEITPSISNEKSGSPLFDYLLDEGNKSVNNMYDKCRSVAKGQKSDSYSQSGNPNTYENSETSSQVQSSNKDSNLEADSPSHNLKKDLVSDTISHSQNVEKAKTVIVHQIEILNNELHLDKYDKNLIFCLTNKHPYYIQFLDYLKLFFECDCTYLNRISIDEHKNGIVKHFMLEGKNGSNEDELFILSCKKHPNRTKFKFYCTDCEYDLCEDCLQEDSKLYSNTNKTYKTHENHTLIELEKITDKFQSISKTIDEYDNLNKIKSYNENQTKNI